MIEFENENLQARRFVLPPIVKPRYRAVDPTPFESALAVGVLAVVIFAVIAALAV